MFKLPKPTFTMSDQTSDSFELTDVRLPIYADVSQSVRGYIAVEGNFTVQVDYADEDFVPSDLDVPFEITSIKGRDVQMVFYARNSTQIGKGRQLLSGDIDYWLTEHNRLCSAILDFCNDRAADYGRQV